MALSGDIKQNYADLQASTGERFSSMADRLTSEHTLLHLDAAGRAGNIELADYLRKQTDDEDAVLKATDPAAYERRQAGTKPDSSPRNRTQDNKSQS